MNASELFEKGQENLSNGNYKEALSCFEKAIEAMPDNAHFISQRGVTFFHLGDKSKALLDMNKSLELEPNNPYRYSSRAFIKAQLGLVETAIEDYKKAIELDPEDAIAHNNLGLLEDQLGFKDKSKKHFEIADELMKKNNLFSDEELKNPTVPKMEKSEPERIAIEPSTVISRNKILKTTLTTSKGWKEFIRFIFNGFKLKE